MTPDDKERDRIFNKQYLGRGFCEGCGDAIHPLDGYEEMLGECPTDGKCPLQEGDE